MDFSIWITFVTASMVLLIIPGPTILLVLSYAISQGRRTALATALGVAVGDLIAMTASLAGLGALVLASATAFTVLKWIGAAYLVYLGVKMFRSAEGATLGGLTQTRNESRLRMFGHAATVTALNPKSIVFFIAFVPQFVKADSALLPQFAILTATFVALAGGNAIIYALMADRVRQKIARQHVIKWITRAGGTALVLMGIVTATVRRSA